jgi:hypothetical protein
MDERGEIREMAAGEPCIPNEITISNETSAQLARMTVDQRKRFWSSFRHNGSEEQAFQRARSR